MILRSGVCGDGNRIVPLDPLVPFTHLPSCNGEGICRATIDETKEAHMGLFGSFVNLYNENPKTTNEHAEVVTCETIVMMLVRFDVIIEYIHLLDKNFIFNLNIVNESNSRYLWQFWH